MDRTLLFIGWAAIIWFAFQTAPITRYVYQPTAVEIDGDQVVLYRSFPTDYLGLPRPNIAYVETVKPLTDGHNGGHVCTDRGGPRVYDSDKEVGTWSLAWAADCLNDPVGYTWSARWSWHIGEISAGPAKLTKTVLNKTCPYRISSTGIIHGPDSQHWAQTSDNDCYTTLEDAQRAQSR